MVEKVIALLLALVGVAFLVLPTFLQLRGELAGDMKVSAFLLIVGGALIWLGGAWRFSKPRPRAPGRLCDFDRYLFRLRRPVEFAAQTHLSPLGDE